MKLVPSLLCDFYKISHKDQYPQGTEYIYSTWTPRSGKHLPHVKEVTVFGHQGFIKEFLIEFFNENFFKQPKSKIVEDYSRVVKHCLFVENPDTSHIEKLHDLGYLPVEVKSLPEGMSVPFRTPILTIENTLPEFFWLTNYLETVMSANLWKPSTTASIAKAYRKIMDNHALKTTGSTEGVQFQGHDFSMRGMGGVEDAARGGAGHLLSFVGTDTIPAINYLEDYYNADITKELVGCSVPASEHSVMCAGGSDNERETYRRLIEDVYPSGIVSIVSDTWDLWYVMTDIIPSLKESILKRSGAPINKVVIRPDSGDPANILCGNPGAEKGTPEYKGVIQLLHETFGGTVNDKGFINLNEKVGAIYGDAITLEKCNEICTRLANKGFTSTNVVFGIGSFTYQYLTRDSLGFAMKATNAVINGADNPIFKNPKTDDGTKKSALGRVKVHKNIKGEVYFQDESSKFLDESEDLLQTIFKDGKLLKEVSLAEIRERINANS
jgi:nicotinamide phosphoribosyltransferase